MEQLNFCPMWQIFLLKKKTIKSRAFCETFDIHIKTDEDLIAYANEQKRR